MRTTPFTFGTWEYIFGNQICVLYFSYDAHLASNCNAVEKGRLIRSWKHAQSFQNWISLIEPTHSLLLYIVWGMLLVTILQADHGHLTHCLFFFSPSAVVTASTVTNTILALAPVASSLVPVQVITSPPINPAPPAIIESPSSHSTTIAPSTSPLPAPKNTTTTPTLLKNKTPLSAAAAAAAAMSSHSRKSKTAAVISVPATVSPAVKKKWVRFYLICLQTHWE